MGNELRKNVKIGSIFGGSLCILIGIGCFILMFKIPEPILILFGLLGLVAGGFELADGIRGKFTYISLSEKKFK